MKNQGIVIHKASKAQIMPWFLLHTMPFLHRFLSTQHNLAVHCDYFWPFPRGLWNDFHITLLGLQLEPMQPSNGHYHPWGRCKQLFQLHVSAVQFLWLTLEVQALSPC